MNILITGASGFIGQHLLERIDCRNNTIFILTRDPQKKRRVQNDLVSCIEGDLTNLESLVNATKNIDCIINIAAEVRDTSKLAVTNIQGVKNLVEASEINNVGKMIHISSVGVVGKQYNFNPELVDEATPETPKNEYERTKLESEKILLNSFFQQNNKLVILRPTNVYGEYHPFNAVLALAQFIQSRGFVITTKTAQLNYVYVKDLCDVIIEATKSPSITGIINVGHSTSFDKFTREIAAILNKKIKVLYIPVFLIKILEQLGIRKLRSLSNSVVYDGEKFLKIVSSTGKKNNGLTETIHFFQTNKMLK